MSKDRYVHILKGLGHEAFLYHRLDNGVNDMFNEFGTYQKDKISRYYTKYVLQLNQNLTSSRPSNLLLQFGARYCAISMICCVGYATLFLQ